jgi:hypothetical protein
MKKFEITIKDKIFGIMQGEFFAISKSEAIAECKTFYAESNDTDESEIEIINCIEL